MKNIASLAAVLALTVAGGTASAQEARIQWGDLNLASAQGADAFDARVAGAARKACRNARAPGRLVSDRAYCEAAFRSEAIGKLPGAAQVDYAFSRLPIVA